jgi:hypothetical protein
VRGDVFDHNAEMGSRAPFFVDFRRCGSSVQKGSLIHLIKIGRDKTEENTGKCAALGKQENLKSVTVPLRNWMGDSRGLQVNEVECAFALHGVNGGRSGLTIRGSSSRPSQ